MIPGVIRRPLNQVRMFLRRSGARGHGTLSSLLFHLPLAIAERGWRKIATLVNNRLLAPTCNPVVLRRFQRSHSALLGDHFYVIVMPGSLHYLIPCLRQLPQSVNVLLLFNGAAGWERSLLRREFPQYPGLRLLTLPRSSLGHGEVITLLLRANELNFGLLDHDLYVFDPTIFQHLELGDGDCVKAVFHDPSRAVGRDYPHTWFMFFNTSALRGIMDKYRVTACSYRRAPARVRNELAALGLGEGVYLKDYLDFFDTLHVLLALAWYEGLEVAYENIEPGDISHLGGTSTGSLGTKDLLHLYMSMCFLEQADSRELDAKYLRHYAPYTSSLVMRAQLPRTAEVADMLRGLDAILGKLEQPSRGQDRPGG